MAGKARRGHPRRTADRRKSDQSGTRRILIVTEGSRTEPNYFNGIRRHYGRSGIVHQVLHSAFGTDPLNIVRYAEHIFIQGSAERNIPEREFDSIYVVFDRDQHANYHSALALARSLDGKFSRNRISVPFKAIVSIPCFELWLLLHFKDIQAPLDCADVLEQLKAFLPDYDKGAPDVFDRTRLLIQLATARATALAAKNSAYTDPEPFTAVHELVAVLTTLRPQP